MTRPLPADLQSRIDAQLATGEFASDVEVLREAIEALERRQRGLRELRGMVAAAEADIAAGRLGVFDREEMKRDVRARLAQRGIGD
jgi:Arc/MetJ-type ribon-helix-helix transcriptional regulator